MRKSRKYYLGLIIACVLLLTGTSSVRANSGQVTVIVEAGRLSVFLKEAAFMEVLDAIGEKSGIKFSTVGEVEPGALTMAFEDLPMEKGLKRLMGARNSVFIYSKDGKVIKVMVLPNSGTLPKIYSKPAPTPVNINPFTGRPNPPPGQQPPNPFQKAMENDRRK